MAEAALLADRLQDPDVVVRTAAAEQLCGLGEEARSAAVQLTEACGDEETVSQWAVAALEQIGTPPATACQQLATLLRDPRELVAYWAATLLGRLGSQAHEAVADLISAVQNAPSVAVQQRSVWALSQIGDTSPATVAALEQAARSADPRLARLATQALQRCK